MNVEKIALEILSIKKVDVPEFKTNEELAKWIEKQEPNTQFTKAIINLETGEVLLDTNETFDKYKKTILPKLLRGQKFKVDEHKEFSREDVFSLESFKKFYTIVKKDNGIFSISRKDLKPFDEIDAENIKMLYTNIIEETDAKQYKYDIDEDIKQGVKYILIKPTGLDQKYLLKNFNDVYKIEEKPLKHWFEEDTSIYSEYDPDAMIPVKIIKKDNSNFAKEDLNVIRAWLKPKNENLGEYFGGANVRLIGSEGSKQLDEDNLIIEFAR